jgi:hypothetical protein
VRHLTLRLTCSKTDAPGHTLKTPLPNELPATERTFFLLGGKVDACLVQTHCRAVRVTPDDSR